MTPAGSSALRRLLDLTLPAAYAWAVTVAWPTWGAPSPWFVQGFSVLALVGLAVGTWLTHRGNRGADAVLLAGFLGPCAGTWLALGYGAMDIDTGVVRGSLGVLGWVLFVIGWTRARGWDPQQLSSVRARFDRTLVGRRVPARGGRVAMALGVVCAAAVLISAWVTANRERALLAHAIALLATLAILNSAVRLGVVMSQPSPRRGSTFPRWDAAVTTLLGAAGGVWLIWSS